MSFQSACSECLLRQEGWAPFLRPSMICGRRATRTARSAISRSMGVMWIGISSNEIPAGHRADRTRWPRKRRFNTAPAAAPAATQAPAAAPAAVAGYPRQRLLQTQRAAPSPVPATEPEITGWVDVGYRWLSGVNGSMNTYRSIVNLGSGPKLFGADLTWIDPKHRLFDALHVRAEGWGGDPYGTFHLDIEKSKLYRFDASYRDLPYFNNLPSYADPLLTRGIILDEQSFDTRRHMGAYSLEFLPLATGSSPTSRTDPGDASSGTWRNGVYRQLERISRANETRQIPDQPVSRGHPLRAAKVPRHDRRRRNDVLQ